MGISYAIGGSTAGFDRAMAHARSVAVSTSAEIATRFAASAAKIDTSFSALASRGGLGGLGGVLKTALAGFLALQAGQAVLAGLKAAAEAAGEAVDRLSDIGKASGSLGVSTTFFQTWTAQARALNVETRDLVAALEMAKRAFTVLQGTGGERNASPMEARLREQLRAGNIGPADLNRFFGADTNEARLRVILDLVERLIDGGRQLAALDLASKVFPEAIVDQIRRGTIELAKLKVTMDDVKNPDLVLFKPEEIARAQELNRRLKEAEATLSNTANLFRADLARAGMQLREDAISWKETVAAGAKILVDVYQGFKAAGRAWQQSGAGLSSGGRPAGPQWLDDEITAAAGGRTPTADERAMTNARATLAGNINPTTMAQAGAASRSMASGFFPDRTNPLLAKEKDTTETLDEVERFVALLERQNGLLQVELDHLGKGNVERERAIALVKLHAEAKKAGREPTEEEIADTLRWAEANGVLEDKIIAARNAQQQLNDVSREFGSVLSEAFKSAVLHGEKLNVVVANLLNRLAAGGIDRAFAALFNAPASGGASPFASLLSSIFGGARAAGGPVQAGRGYLVGEKGPELFMPKSAGVVVPNHAITRSGGSDMRVAVSVNVSGARGNAEIQSMVASGVQQGMAQVMKAVPGVAVQAMKAQRAGLAVR